MQGDRIHPSLRRITKPPTTNRPPTTSNRPLTTDWFSTDPPTTNSPTGPPPTHRLPTHCPIDQAESSIKQKKIKKKSRNLLLLIHKIGFTGLEREGK